MVKSFFIILCFFLLYLFFLFPTINDPISYDELHGVIPAQSLLETGKPLGFLGETVKWSPLLGVRTLSIFYRVFGVSNWSTRLVGVCCVFLHLLIFLFLGRVLVDNLREQRLFLIVSCLLFITNPATIQGSLILSDDTYLFPLFVSVFAIFFFKYEKERSAKYIIILGVILSLSLWLKIAYLPFLPGAMILYYLIKKDFKGILISLFVTLSGVILFLATWQLYCTITGIEFSGPIQYSSGVFINMLFPKVFDSPLTGLAVNSVRLFLWIGLYSILMWLFVIVNKIGDYRKKRRIEPISFLILFSSILGVGYFFIGGMSFGFPRYQYAMLPAMSIVCAFVLKDILPGISRRDFLMYGVITSLFFLFYTFIIGDLLYIINFSLREASVFFPNQTKSILLNFSLKSILYILPFVALYIFIRLYGTSNRLKKKMALVLLIMISATNLSLNVLHFRADYSVRYCYGEKGTERLLKYLNKNVRMGDAVLATNDIIYYLRDKYIPHLDMNRM